MTNECSVTDDEIASYIACKAEELRRVCDVKGWSHLATTLASVVSEATKLAEKQACNKSN